MNNCTTFGDFVKRTRLGNGLTARQASEAAGMLPSNFSKLEHGALNPPKDAERQKNLAAAIGINDVKELETFFDLAAKATDSMPVDIAAIISEEDALPLLLRTIGNKRLSKDDVKRLVEIVRGTGSANTANK
jgi:transcriptional regulator with XRE-family HTH domain